MGKQMSGIVAVLGGSYVGIRVARELASKLPSSHRVSVLIEKNSHFHHLFTFPRFAVLLRGGEEKAFVPYSHLFTAPHTVLNAHITRIDPERKTLHAVDGQTIHYDALALATGTRLESPWNIDVQGGKPKAVTSLQEVQDRVKEAQRVVIVGGGAVGVQVAFDVRQLYPQKEVVLVHSRQQLMNKFHRDLHDLVISRFENEDIETVLGSRVVLPAKGYPPFNPGQLINVDLQNGSQVHGDLVLLCTGQTPRSDLLAAQENATTPSGFIRVNSNLQLPSSDSIFALGDVADTGAPKTVRAAAGQVGTVAHNIMSYLGLHSEGMKSFTPGPAGIHLTLGLKESVKFRNPEKEGEKPVSLVEEDGHLDMNAARMWDGLGVPKGTDWNL